MAGQIPNPPRTLPGLAPARCGGDHLAGVATGAGQASLAAEVRGAVDDHSDQEAKGERRQHQQGQCIECHGTLLVLRRETIRSGLLLRQCGSLSFILVPYGCPVLMRPNRL